MDRKTEQIMRDATDEILKLRAQLAEARGTPLRKAIDAALATPAQGDTGRNRFVTAAVKKDLFTKTTPVSKAARAANTKKSRVEIRREREKLSGLRPSKFEKES